MMMPTGPAHNPLDNLFGGIGAVDPNGGRGEFLTPGIYVVDVDRMFLKQSRESGIGCILSMRIVQTSVPDPVQVPDIAAPGGYRLVSHPVGCTRSWWTGLGNDLVTPSEKRDMGMQNIKAMLIAAANFDYVQFREWFDANAAALWKGAVSTLNPLAGVRMHLECSSKPTRARGAKPAGTFTVHTFAPWQGGPHADLAALQDAARNGMVGIAPAAVATAGVPMGAPPYGSPAWGPPAAAPAFAPPSAAPQAWTYHPDGVHASSDGGRTWVRVAGR